MASSNELIDRVPRILAADPTAALGAATKQYVDSGVASALPLTGGTLSFPSSSSLTLESDGSNRPVIQSNWEGTAVSQMIFGNGNIYINPGTTTTPPATNLFTFNGSGTFSAVGNITGYAINGMYINPSGWTTSGSPSFGGLAIASNIQSPQGEVDFISGNGGANGYGFNFYSRAGASPNTLTLLGSINTSAATFNVPVSAVAGGLSLPSYAGTASITKGNADAASLTQYDIAFNSWWGIGFPTYNGSNYATLDTRTGSWILAGSISAGTGATFGSGINFGSVTASSTSDLSKHIALWGSSYGFNVTGSSLNYNSGGQHYFWQQVNVESALNVAGAATAASYTQTWPQATGTIANGGGGGNYGFVCHANNNGGSSATSCAAITFIRDNSFGCYFGLDTDNQFKVGGWSFGNASYRVVTEQLAAVTLPGTLTVNGTGAGTITSGGFNAVNDGWYRSTGNAGWYSTTYASGIYMTGATYVQAYNGGKFQAADFVISSDIKLKEDIVDMKPRARLRPREFTIKSNGERKFGFIAQEIEVAYPECIGITHDEDSDEVTKHVSYATLTAALAAQLNQALDKIEELESRLASLELHHDRF